MVMPESAGLPNISLYDWAYSPLFPSRTKKGKMKMYMYRIRLFLSEENLEIIVFTHEIRFTLIIAFKKVR